MNDNSHLVGRFFCSIQSTGPVETEQLKQINAVQSESEGQVEVACMKPSHAINQLIWTMVSLWWEAWKWGQGWEDSVQNILRPQTEKRVVSLQPFLADHSLFSFNWRDLRVLLWWHMELSKKREIYAAHMLQNATGLLGRPPKLTSQHKEWHRPLTAESSCLSCVASP